SEGIPHVRTDFYCINDNLYFGELTFFHEAGLGTFRPVEWDKYLGSLISI
ncbi:glycosyl transferase, partial [Bacteroides cellulosilyticus]